jgi:peptidoglycan/LPS O-acetylase OafA/YrhL
VSAVLLVQAWVPPLALLWNPPGWSLSAEAFFYAVFPRLGPMLWRTARPYTAIAGCWAALMASAALVSWLDPHSPSWPWGEGSDTCALNAVLNYNPLLRLPEFAAGILAARLWRDGGARWQRWSILTWLAPLTAAMLLAWRAPLQADLVALGLFCPVFAVWLIALAQTSGGLSRFLALPACVRLGEWSYALYVLHIPVWGLILAVNQENGQLMNPKEPPFLAVTFALALGLSAAVHRFIEVPYRKAFLHAWRPVAGHA